MKLYYAHRLSDPHPAVRAHNLSRAKARFADMPDLYPGDTVIAPWIILAEDDTHEEQAWDLIEVVIKDCGGIILDLDGTDWPSPGMIRERDIMLAVGGKVEVVR